MPTEQSLGHYEMLWDCPYCGTRKLLGVTHRYCPQCGAPQDPTRRYFPSDDEKIAVEDHVFVGADRVCQSCGSPQSAKASHCGHCGAPLDASPEVKRVDAAPAPKAAASLPRRKRRWWIVAVVVAVFLAGFYTLCLWKKTAEMTVLGRRWERAIEIQEYREVTREAWREQVPLMARGVTCFRQQRSSRQIPDGETCRDEKKDKGDGSFEMVRKCTPKFRSEPVYDERCRYFAQDWVRVDEAVQRGVGGAAEPAWPAVSLPAVRQGLGARREGPRREAYIVDLQEKGGGQHACKVAANKWAQYKNGQVIKIEVGAVTGRVACDSLP